MIKRTGLFGGSFDPVHCGHLMVAQNALETFDLTEIWFVPSHVAPHKTSAPATRQEHRLAMLALAIEHNPYFSLCQEEIQRGGISYTAETVGQLLRLHPHRRFTLIIGADSLLELHAWKDVERLLRLCEIATFARPGYELTGLRPEDLKLPSPWPEKLLAGTTTGVRMDLSSSDVRHRVAEGMSIRYMVPPEVEMYIAEHSLYQGGAD